MNADTGKPNDPTPTESEPKHSGPVGPPPYLGAFIEQFWFCIALEAMGCMWEDAVKRSKYHYIAGIRVSQERRITRSE